MPQMGIQPEKEREGGRKRDIQHGGSQISKKLFREAGLRNWSILYCSGKPFILLAVHRDQWIIQNYVGSAALTLTKTRLSANLSIYKGSQVIYIIFRPEGQLTIYSPFLIRVIVFFPKSGATLRKH